jgi:peptidoglycan/xylan/chitin deacetylase (PgdA/CDA1 family)
MMDLVNVSLHRLYRAAQRNHPGILYYGEGSRHEIALTFDDGPHPRDTSRLLDVLHKHQVRATFHLVGKSAEHHPDLVRQIQQSGHQPALHCYRHLPLVFENQGTLKSGLEHTRNVIAEAAGLSPASIRDLRPPYGLLNARTRARLEGWGYRIVMWSCIPPHWMQPVGWSIHQIMDSIVPGSVIVLHDGHGHGRRVSEIVDEIVPRIRGLGLKFVTVEEMQSWRNKVAVHSEEAEVDL